MSDITDQSEDPEPLPALNKLPARPLPPDAVEDSEPAGPAPRAPQVRRSGRVMRLRELVWWPIAIIVVLNLLVAGMLLLVGETAAAAVCAVIGISVPTSVAVLSRAMLVQRR